MVKKMVKMAMYKTMPFSKKKNRFRKPSSSSNKK